MKVRFLRVVIWIFCCGIPWCGVSAELEDFAGGVTNTRLTVNPASVAAIDRFHTQYGAFQYQGDNLPRATLFSEAQYDEGTTTFANFGLAWPRQWGGLGIAYKTNLESYSSNRSAAEDNSLLGTICYSGPSSGCEIPVSIDQLKHTAEINETLVSALLGFAFSHMMLGIRANQRTIDYRYGNDYHLKENPVNHQTEVTMGIQYTSFDVGVTIPDLFSIFDLGLVYRPEVTGTASVPAQQSTDPNVTPPSDFSSSHYVSSISWDTDQYYLANPQQKGPFIEPALTLFGLGMTLSFGDSVALQILGDSGSFTSSEASLDGEQTGGSISGQLIRLVIAPILDISSGIQTQEIGILEIKKQTNSVQFPFVEGTNLKIGSQTLTFTNLDSKEELAEVSLLLLSLNVQFGKPVKRKSGTRTKKRINFVDRPGSF